MMDIVKLLLDWEEYDEGKINDARAEAATEIERLREALNKIVEVEGWPNRKGRDSPMARIAVEALGEHVKRFCF